MSDGTGLQAARRQVSALLDEWDPIGVYGAEEQAEDRWPPGEYERLVTPVLTRLQAGDDAASLAAYLAWDATVNMGLSSVVGEQEAARRLHDWWQHRER